MTQTEAAKGDDTTIHRKRWILVWVPVILFLAAVAVRLPYFTEIPRFRGNELGVTLELVNMERFPLFNQHPHIGALSNYLHAVGFWILGMHYWVPGFLTVLAGAATVVFTYYLGLRTSGFAVAFVGTILMVVSVFHVYFISHVPWSNCLTPFFVVLFALCFTRALQEKSTGWFVFSGLIYGMAQQTHPSVITILPGVLFLFLIQGKETVRWWLKNRKAYLILLAVVLGVANLLLYNLTSQWHSIRYEITYPKYALEQEPGLQSFFENSFGAWTLILRLLSGSMETRLIGDYWIQPMFLVMMLLLIVGMVATLLTRKWVVPALFLSAITLIPIVNRSYELCTLGRYLGLLIPFGTLLCASAVVGISTRLSKIAGRWPGFVVGVGLTGLILFTHVSALHRTYDALKRTDHSYVYLSTLKMLNPYEKENTSILVDPQAHDFRMLIPFLESDGWQVDPLRVETPSGKGIRSSPFRQVAMQVQELERLFPGKKIICFLSPLNLKRFTKDVSVESLEAILKYDEKEKRRNLYNALLGNVYYLFGLSSREKEDDRKNAPLQALLMLRPYIPDDLHIAIGRPGSRKIKKIEVPGNVRKIFDVQMEHIATEVPVFPPTNSSICMDEKEFLRKLARGHKIE